jgi:hypothetical protein
MGFQELLIFIGLVGIASIIYKIIISKIEQWGGK